jgi:protein-disulfide isomerase
MEKKRKEIIFISILSAVVIISAVIAGLSKPTEQKPSAKKYEIPIGRNYSSGASSSQLTIVEFSDFACPYCQKSSATVRKFGLKYGDSVKIIYRDFPLHEESIDLAISGRCAGEQGYFWPMHDKLFSMQGKTEIASLPDLAATLGLNAPAFKKCLSEKKYLNDIKKDYLDGQTLGVTGTPTFFFNGYKIAGEIPAENFEKIIKEFLK